MYPLFTLSNSTAGLQYRYERKLHPHHGSGGSSLWILCVNSSLTMLVLTSRVRRPPSLAQHCAGVGASSTGAGTTDNAHAVAYKYKATRLPHHYRRAASEEEALWAETPLFLGHHCGCCDCGDCCSSNRRRCGQQESELFSNT